MEIPCKTVGRRHSFIPARIIRLIRNLGWNESKVKFVFIVPGSRFDEFKCQQPLTLQRKPMKAQASDKIKIEQYHENRR
jgi:hypothetical protein